LGRFKGADKPDARIVHKNIDRPDSFDRHSDAFIARDVQPQDSKVLGTRQNVGVRRAHGGDDVPAIGQEVTGGLEAVARGRTGNQDRLHWDFHLYGHQAIRARERLLGVIARIGSAMIPADRKAFQMRERVSLLANISAGAGV
jgi:hypothetical protein